MWQFCHLLPPLWGCQRASGVTALPRGVLCLLFALVCFGLVFLLSWFLLLGQAVCVAGGLLFLSYLCAHTPRVLASEGLFLGSVSYCLCVCYSVIHFSTPAFVGLSAPRAPV